MAKVQITDTILRDGHQSQAATRMRLDEMLPACERLDKVGYFSLECWGGATFDSCIRFLNEDPWERLRQLKKALPNTKTQMLLRGQNLLGYRPYSDDVVEFFVKKAIENGIDIIRCFDALNDLRNMQTAVKATKKYGGKAEIAMSYTESPVHNEDYFVRLAADIQKMGADMICIKDMANLLLPYKAYSLIRHLKAETDLPIVVHTHNTTGTGDMVLLKSIEAGADVVDTCLSPLGSGTSQPATESLVATLQGTEYDTGLDLNLLAEIADYFRPIQEKYLENGRLSPKVMGVNIKTLLYQVPGGMLSNLVSQLKEAKAEDKYYDVLEEIPRVRKDLGEPPLVTPSSQIVGTQAVLNVLQGERYKMITKETRKVLKGEFGQTIKPFNPEVQKLAIGDEEPITCRPADLIEPQLDNYRKEIKDYIRQDEDVLSYALFPQVAMDFFKYRDAQDKKVDETAADKENKSYPV